MLSKNFYMKDVHEIMLWKFFWNYQNHHVMGNHVMEKHVRQWTAVIQFYQRIAFTPSVELTP